MPVAESLQPLDPGRDNLFDAAEIAPILIEEGLYEEGKALEAVVEVAASGKSENDDLANKFLSQHRHQGALCLRETISDESDDEQNKSLHHDEFDTSEIVQEQTVTGIITASGGNMTGEKRLLVHDDTSPPTNHENGKQNHELPRVGERHQMKSPDPKWVVGCNVDTLSVSARRAVRRAVLSSK